MNRFCCKFCGMITDNPEIVPHPDKDKEYREIGEKLHKQGPSPEKYWTSLSYEMYEASYSHKYNHSITCPVCLNETRFWRDEPFPTDKPSPVDKVMLNAETRIRQVLDEEIDKAKTKGANVIGIEFPRLTSWKGIPIFYYLPGKEGEIDLKDIPSRVV